MGHALETATTSREPARRVEAGPGRDGGAEVVFTFSYVTWQAAAERGWCHSEDRLARFLFDAPRVQRLLVCEPVRSLPRKLVRDWLNPPVEPFRAGPNRRLLSPVRMPGTIPTAIPKVADWFAGYDRALHRAAQSMGLENPVVITAHPLVAGFAELSWARAVTFYAVDDWSAHPAFRPWWPAYREAAVRWRGLGRRVVAVSDALLERIGPVAHGIVVPNGLDPAEWTGSGRAPAWAEKLPRPLLVYAGTLDSRLDTELLRHLAQALPHATVLLVGALIEPSHFESLRSLPNVVLRAPLGRAEIAGLIRSADVGLIPHARSRLTEAMSPLKLYEYLAAGRPVAATDLAPMRSVNRRVFLAVGYTDFADAVRAALASGPMSEDERLSFLGANSWGARHEQVLDLALR